MSKELTQVWPLIKPNINYTGQIVNRYALEIPQAAVVPCELWMLASLQWSNFSSSCKLYLTNLIVDINIWYWHHLGEFLSILWIPVHSISGKSSGWCLPQVVCPSLEHFPDYLKQLRISQYESVLIRDCVATFLPTVSLQVMRVNNLFRIRFAK